MSGSSPAAEPLLTLYQAEWCPFSSAVREALTEVGLDFVARQVAPWADQRVQLKAHQKSAGIPVLETADGKIYIGIYDIFDYLKTCHAWEFEAPQRSRFEAHAQFRKEDVVNELIAYFRGTDELEADSGPLEGVVVADVPASNRYELTLNGHLVGLVAYSRAAGSITFKYTQVHRSCCNRGLGSRLAAKALYDAQQAKVSVIPLDPFYVNYILWHPEFIPLVPAGYLPPSAPAPPAEGSPQTAAPSPTTTS